ncbi:MAG: bifunctional hydroxymethylpyrimidine kinase/phosphomethylpyrimidine kinase [Eubacteriales bacterium]|nr:bifunctional hydroxymethylpyrimidine kinase/phosphomethylpyrimidine kinase [Eubacteriales bacterium]
MSVKRNTVLTIAGSDCSGGAGIQADLKTMTAMGLYGMSVITALTAQNTTGVYGIYDVDPAFAAAQMDCVFQDIYPDAVKIGMVSRREMIDVIGGKLEEYGAVRIVLDPVMVSTSGSRLLAEDAMDALAARLLPLAEVMTPNLPEAEILSGMTIAEERQMEQAAKIIAEKYGGAVLVKGGHQVGSANDVLYRNGKLTWFPGKRIETENTHGTGCTLSSAIACGLAEGKTVEASVLAAKEYLTGALASGLDLGKGKGPLDHCFSCGTGVY